MDGCYCIEPKSVTETLDTYRCTEVFNPNSSEQKTDGCYCIVTVYCLETNCDSHLTIQEPKPLTLAVEIDVLNRIIPIHQNKRRTVAIVR